MERRTYERLHVNFQARLFYGNMVYTGTVTNLSENGMFIRTMMRFPVNLAMITVIRAGERIFKIPVRIKRSVESENNFKRIEDFGRGVQILNHPVDYMELISEMRAST